MSATPYARVRRHDSDVMVHRNALEAARVAVSAASMARDAFGTQVETFLREHAVAELEHARADVRYAVANTRSLTHEQHAQLAAAQRELDSVVVIAATRDESDPCERGTNGCAVDHAHSGRACSCETW